MAKILQDARSGVQIRTIRFTRGPQNVGSLLAWVHFSHESWGVTTQQNIAFFLFIAFIRRLLCILFLHLWEYSNGATKEEARKRALIVATIIGGNGFDRKCLEALSAHCALADKSHWRAVIVCGKCRSGRELCFLDYAGNYLIARLTCWRIESNGFSENENRGASHQVMYRRNRDEKKNIVKLQKDYDTFNFSVFRLQ